VTEDTGAKRVEAIEVRRRTASELLDAMAGTACQGLAVVTGLGGSMSTAGRCLLRRCWTAPLARPG
jgi:hypothetical protein